MTGGLLWWKGIIIVGCYNLAALQDEVRAYPRAEKLDNAFAKIFKVDAQVKGTISKLNIVLINTLMLPLQVLLLNLLNDQLIVFCADNQIDIFNLSIDPSLSCK